MLAMVILSRAILLLAAAITPVARFGCRRRAGRVPRRAPGVVRALPVCFNGRYDKDEDDFLGETFFDHPIVASDEIDDDNEAKLGNGRTSLSRGHKKLCGFVFLRTLRTGSRALSLQRGSLLDAVLRLSGAGAAEMWRDTLGKLQTLDPAIRRRVAAARAANWEARHPPAKPCPGLRNASTG